MPRRQFASVLGIAALMAALFILAPGGAAAATTCVPANNIEAIIDDSGSMSGTDSAVNRVQGLKILIGKSGNAKKTLGAVEFGGSYTGGPPAADTVFAPQLIGPNGAAMGSALDAKILADNGTTDYNAAFAQATADNPAANARIFLTDGGHNAGDYTNGHQGGPPTYVIGLGTFITGADDARLAQIASETGGVYYPHIDTSNVAATMNQIDAALNCQAVGQTFTNQFTKVGQSTSKVTKISSKTKSIDLVLTWADPLDQFTIGSIKLQTKNGTIASVSKKRLKIKRSLGKTFLDVHISGLTGGKLRFKLSAKTLGSSLAAGGVKLTTQATQSRSK